ncbi:hypothetical protein GCM10009566_12030 [Streptomyces murinus]
MIRSSIASMRSRAAAMVASGVAAVSSGVVVLMAGAPDRSYADALERRDPEKRQAPRALSARGAWDVA